MRPLLLACTVLAVAEALSSAQTAARKPAPGTLHMVTVKGNQRYASEAIISASGLTPGQKISTEGIEAARQKLQKTELFNDVSDRFRFAGTPPAYDVTFEVVENQQLFPIRFERLNVSAIAIRDYLHDHVPLYSDKIPGSEGVLRRYTTAIEDYGRENHLDRKVKAVVSNDDPAQLAVVFMPDAPAPNIAQVTVTGNQVVDTGAILRALNPVAIGVPYSETRLQQILNGSVKTLYAAKGYPAVSFSHLETQPSKTNEGLDVKLQITDGPQFHFGSIRFHGTGLDQDEIRSNIPFKPGQVFNGNLIDDFRLSLQHGLRRKGNLDASVTNETVNDDAKQTVSVTYNVVPGALYNFAKLDIQGLDVTTAPAVEKLWGEKPGKPFNPDYPDFFLKRLEEQNLFEHLANTSSDYTADPSSHDVVVHLYFKGGESKKEKDRNKQSDRDRQQSDGTWSPYP